MMAWTKKDFPDSMKNLKEDVRNKSIEIANRLLEDGYEEGRAISIAISQAKEWYDNRGGSISADVTHHLIPHEEGWLLKSLEDEDDMAFETKEDAMSEVRKISKEKKIKVMIHDSEGKFQDVY